jgi:hypothetical protein
VVATVEPERADAGLSPALPTSAAQQEPPSSAEHAAPASVAPAAPAIARYSADDDDDDAAVELGREAPHSAPPPSLPIIEARPLASHSLSGAAESAEQELRREDEVSLPDAPAASPAARGPSRWPWIVLAVVLALIVAAAIVFLVPR